MIRLPPRATLTDTRVPYTALFRSIPAGDTGAQAPGAARRRARHAPLAARTGLWFATTFHLRILLGNRVGSGGPWRGSCGAGAGVVIGVDGEIGRAHVRHPVTNEHLVCRLQLEQKNHIISEKNKHTKHNI